MITRAVTDVRPLSYQGVKPSETGLKVELTGDGGVRASLLTWPRFWERLWWAAVWWLGLGVALGIMAMYLWLFRFGPPPDRFLATILPLGFLYGAALAVYCVAAAGVKGGVIVEVAVRDGFLECTYAMPLWRRRRRWRAQTVTRVTVARELSNRRWAWAHYLSIRRRGGLTIKAFAEQPTEELEWAASGLRDALGLVK
jgi:hypothetical protein